MSDFKVGQKVIFVGEAPPALKAIAARDVGDFAEKGAVYEVRWIGIYTFIEGDLPACKFVGHERITHSRRDMRVKNFDVPYAQMYFRPVEEQINEVSIEIFRKIARDVTEGKSVEIVGD